MDLAIKQIFTRLGKSDLVRLKNSSRTAQYIERKYSAEFDAVMSDILDRAIADLRKDGRLNTNDYDLEGLIMRHWFDSLRSGFELAENDSEFRSDPDAKLAGAISRSPRNLKELMALWDLYRKKKYVNRAKRAQAESIKKEYLNKIQDAWRRYSDDFVRGEVFDQRQAFERIKSVTGAPRSRAQTIVNTETTNYYNEARKKIYDASPDVTHYLFVAVRDAATTKWCSPNRSNGLRGRHGLVYAKGDPLTERERPACHWNCRSEFLPLTRQNPVHLALIEDLSIRRRNVQCHPLPANWAA